MSEQNRSPGDPGPDDKIPNGDIPDGLGPEFDYVVDPWAGLAKFAKQSIEERLPFLFVSCKDVSGSPGLNLTAIILNSMSEGSAEHVMAMFAYLIDRYARYTDQRPERLCLKLLDFVGEVRAAKKRTETPGGKEES